MLRAAIALADADGIESLTMRKLAEKLGVEAMSLYYYFRNKEDILAGILELVLSEIAPPVPGPDWKASLRRSAISFHDALTRHPWASRLLTSSTKDLPRRLRYPEAVLATLRQAGFSAELTDHTYHALDSHIVGFTLWQVSFPFKNKQELVALATGFLRQFPAEEYPYMTEHVHHHLRPSAPSGKTAFEFGLDLILDGVERLRDASDTERGAKRKTRTARGRSRRGRGPTVRVAG